MSLPLENGPPIHYLLRIWRESGPSPATVWRYRVENLRTRSQRTFTDLDDLLAFLEDQIRVDQTNRDRSQTGND